MLAALSDAAKCERDTVSQTSVIESHRQSHEPMARRESKQKDAPRCRHVAPSPFSQASPDSERERQTWRNYWRPGGPFGLIRFRGGVAESPRSWTCASAGGDGARKNARDRPTARRASVAARERKRKRRSLSTAARRASRPERREKRPACFHAADERKRGPEYPLSTPFACLLLLAGLFRSKCYRVRTKLSLILLDLMKPTRVNRQPLERDISS